MNNDKYYLNLAGEYRVCSELLKRGIFATVTYGNMKGVDIVAVGTNRRASLIEVKASSSLRFVTSFYQKYKTVDCEHPTFWVLYSASKNDLSERFFILTHEEMAAAQAQRNDPAKKLGYSEMVERYAQGVDNVIFENIKDYESQWEKIVHYCNDSKIISQNSSNGN